MIPRRKQMNVTVGLVVFSRSLHPLKHLYEGQEVSSLCSLFFPLFFFALGGTGLGTEYEKPIFVAQSEASSTKRITRRHI